MTLFRNDINVLGLVYLGKYTTTQRNSLVLTATDAGGLIYDTDLQTLYYYNGTAWSTFTSVTNLGLSINGDDITITNSAGTGVVLPVASTIAAGVLAPTDFTNFSNLISLTGVAAGSTLLTPFTGTTIPDGSTLKSALQALETSTEAFAATKGVADGLASLDATGKIPTSQLPALAITDVYVVATIAARDALTVQTGDVAKVTNSGSGFPATYIYDGTTWIDIQESSDVISVNGLTGQVSLTSALIPYSNASAPIGSPTATAVDAQAAIDALNVSLNTVNNAKKSAVFSFTTGSWGTAVAGKYNLIITAAQHLLTGTLTDVQVQEQTATNIFNVVGATVEINNSTKDIKLTIRATPDNRFAGRVIINQL